jgi:tetratricopeptide (TPR) repeat protein
MPGVAAAFAGTLILAAPAPAAETDPAQAAAYAHCMRLAQSAPQTAFEMALDWEDRGGGRPARHCAAVSLFVLEQFPQAAERFEALAQEVRAEDPGLVAGALAQAGQAWLRAGNTSRAYAAQTTALGLLPDDVELLIDRGVTLSASDRQNEAIADFTRALAIDPNRIDALIFRATAERYADKLEQARQDLDRALTLYNDHPEALLERGIVRRLMGDDAGAREDWLAVVRHHSGSEAAETAQRNLEALELGQD